MEERLQKILSLKGATSRRGAEKLIEEGRVTVNGVTAVIGQKANAESDVICIDGIPLRSGDKLTYIMLNKPEGYVTTMSDEKGRKTVWDLVKELGIRVYPVGRLDMDSRGLVIMTNDGELANSVMHPSYEKNKKYLVKISGNTENIDLLTKPMDIDGYIIKPAEIAIIKKTSNSAEIEMVIHEGRNRQIRKMCAKCGFDVNRLERVAIGKLELGNLAPGAWRHLTIDEIKLISE